MCIACIFAGLLTACGGGETDYTSGNAPYANGHTGVEVVFELEGGVYQNTDRHVRMYYYIPEDGETLIAPPGEYSGRDIIRQNYHITGWYKTRNESADGTVTYSDAWDFTKDKVKSGDESLTLYCGWAPNVVYTYEICYFDESGTEQVYTSIETKEGMPFTDTSNLADGRRGFTAKREKNEETGKYEIVYYKGKEGGNWIPWDETFTHPGGEVSTAVKVYVEYLKGDFVYVSTADEFMSAVSGFARSGNGVYLTDDIDLTGEKAIRGFRDNAGKFTGVFFGNGHTVTGLTLDGKPNYPVISSEQALLGDKALCVSLFGNLDGATISDVTFTGVTLEVDVSYNQLNDVFVAPLAVLAKDSTVEKVHVDGSFTIKKVDTGSDKLIAEYNKLVWQEGFTVGADCSVDIEYQDNRS